MSATIRTRYRGWDISVRCLQHSNSDMRAERVFTGRAFAVLHDEMDPACWMDPRPQTTSLSAHKFGTAAKCKETLLAQMEVAIDALKKFPESAGCWAV